MSSKSDNFHDFFTEYVPYGEECVLYFEERDFYRRFPNASRNQNRVPSEPKDAGSSKVTIPSKSGLSSKVTQEEDEQSGADVSQRGPHMSAVKEKADKSEEKAAAAEKPKSGKSSKQDKKPTLSVPTIELAQVKEGGEAIVQDLVKTFNDIITVISADED